MNGDNKQAGPTATETFPEEGKRALEQSDGLVMLRVVMSTTLGESCVFGVACGRACKRRGIMTEGGFSSAVRAIIYARVVLPIPHCSANQRDQTLEGIVPATTCTTRQLASRSRRVRVSHKSICRVKYQ